MSKLGETHGHFVVKERQQTNKQQNNKTTKQQNNKTKKTNRT
jgi:hypothetical protein